MTARDECLKKLSEKGYFNGIDPFTKVHDIIDKKMKGRYIR